MELLAVRTARLIARLNAEELNPSGRSLAHDFFNAFVERYKFIKRPTTADEMLDTENKGISFELGKLNEIGITKITLFDWGVAVDTNASTEACEEILQDILQWGAKTFGLSNRPDLITQRNFLSEIVFSSNLSLPAINPQLNALGLRITDLVTKNTGRNSQPFELSGINLSFDQSQSKQVFTPFQLFRLADTPFSEKKYYSGAPLRTSDHLQIIRDFELAFPPEGVLALPIE